jgi:predicted Fe-Mo cluster-binding NifX family protein
MLCNALWQKFFKRIMIGMKIALTVWGNRISPVFDAAQTLLVVEIKDNKIIKKSYESFDSDTMHLPGNLKKMGISVLICGAISRMPANIIASSGIQLIAFVTGNAAQILNLYLNNNPVPLSCFMPGCRRHGCRHGLKSTAINIERG